MKPFFLIFLISFIFYSIRPSFSAITKIELDEIFATFHSIYDDTLPENEQIRFNPPSMANISWWDYNVWRGSYTTYIKDSIRLHNIYIFGGLAKRDFVTVDGVALIICHELGHGFGGWPYKINDGATIEGQADYYATNGCLKLFFKRWPDERTFDFLDQKIKDRCLIESSDYYTCLRAYTAINERILKFKDEGGHPSFFTRDPTIVSEINLADAYYPSYQCRIDTYLAGFFNNKRPACWFVEE